MSGKLDETTLMIQDILLERFGEPIDGATATVGITDDRSGKVASRGESQEPDEDETILDERDVDEVYENTVKKLKGKKGVKKLRAITSSS